MTLPPTTSNARAAQFLVAAGLALSALSVTAKLPAASDEAKAKAAEAAAKTAHGNKVADFQLCNAQNRVATKYAAEAKKSGKEVKATDTPACADPGAFVYAPALPASGAVVAAAPSAAAPVAAASAPGVAASK